MYDVETTGRRPRRLQSSRVWTIIALRWLVVGQLGLELVRPKPDVAACPVAAEMVRESFTEQARADETTGTSYETIVRVCW